MMERPRTESPYVGPSPFRQDQRDLFFGREREIARLAALVSANPVTLFYGQSGAGKSSVINAGLVPELRQDGYEVLPATRVGIDARGWREAVNIFVYNAIAGWIESSAELPADLAQMSIADYLALRERERDEYELPVPRVIIFDQFEELFRTHPDRWQDRQPFFQQVAVALEKDSLLRVVFVMREDYIAELDPFAAELPDKFRVRLRLELLRQPAALDAVNKPLEQTPVRFAPDAAEKLVDDLLAIRSPETGDIIAGEFVEPVYLQVVCDNLWYEARRQNVSEITVDALDELGNVNNALANFYETCVTDVAREYQIAEDEIRRWFEAQLITPEGTRNRLRRSDRERMTSGFDNSALERLEDLHLLRSDLQSEARWYELAHDRMIAPILRVNEKARIAANQVVRQEARLQGALDLSAEAFTQFADLLMPFVRTPNERQTLLAAAFGVNSPLLRQIDVQGPAHVFSINLVTTLVSFGEVSPRTPALWALLQTVRSQVGVDKQAQIDALGSALNVNADSKSAQIARKRIYLSYARTDTDFAQRLAQSLSQAGIDVDESETTIKVGSRNWENVIRQSIREADAIVLIASPSSRRSNYVASELALAQDRGKPIFPVWAEGDDWTDSVSFGMMDAQYLDARGERFSEAASRLVQAIIGLGLSERKAEIRSAYSPRNPYKGLMAFREEDRDDFFGREQLVDSLLASLRRQPTFLALIGASGSGKSSVLRAGLIPRLKGGALPDSQLWTYVKMAPGSAPLDTLTQALASLWPDQPPQDIQLALRSQNGIARVIKPILARNGRLIIVIDQFEELFTLANEQDRDEFIHRLLESVSNSDRAIGFLITLRADFFYRPLVYPELARLLQQHSIIVTPMNAAEIRDAIVKPAELVGLTIETGLVEQLIADTANELGALPLMQFTLDLLFQHRENTTLTLQAYNDIGGVRGRLAHHVEEVYQSVPKDVQAVVRPLFLRLVEVNETGLATRRRLSMGELTFADDRQTKLIQRAAEAFIAARILVAARTEHEDTLELVHEAVIREWSRLRQWIEVAKDDVRLLRTIAEFASTWENSGRDSSFLFFGSRLIAARDWANRNIPSMSETEFIEEAYAYEQQEIQRLEQLIQRVDRSRRNANLAIVVAVAVVLLAIIVSIFAGNQVQSAQESASAAETQIVFAQATLTQAAATANSLATNIANDSFRLTANAALAVTSTPTFTASPSATVNINETSTADSAALATQVELILQTITHNAPTAQSQTQLPPTGFASTGAALTQTAARWTDTPTPDIRSTAESRLTATIVALETQYPTLTAIQMTQAVQATQTATVSLLGFASNPVTSNAQWTPFNQSFDGISMVLVPSGCFVMGSTDGGSDEQPTSEQCFDTPFWIDQTEISQADFARFGGLASSASSFIGAHLPREQITWLEARDFCELRGARLPTEVEWEYAARGPDSLVYPWGNIWVADNAVSSINSARGTADVGSRPGGVSWVAAYELSGNVSEWVSSQYLLYPYVASDGREDISDMNSARVIRGGSWLLSNTDQFRGSYRVSVEPTSSFNSIGFRCARSF